MKLFAFVSMLAVLLLAGCGDKPATPVSATNSTTSSGNPLNAPADYLGGLANARNRAVKTVDVAALNQAVQLFNVQEGRLPKDLNELVEKKLIARIPEVPYGMKLDYDAATGVVNVVNAQ